MTCFTGVDFFFFGGKISVIYKFFIYEKGKKRLRKVRTRVSYLLVSTEAADHSIGKLHFVILLILVANITGIDFSTAGEPKESQKKVNYLCHSTYTENRCTPVLN